MNASLLVIARVSWIDVAKKISRRLGKEFSASYVRRVASGLHADRTVANLCRALGVIDIEPQISAEMLCKADRRWMRQKRRGHHGRKAMRQRSAA